MKNAFAAIAAATLVLGGCASEGSRDTDKAKSSAGDVGKLDMKLTGPQGYVINSATYTITGTALSAPRTKSMDLTNSSQLRFQVGDLPIATGYVIALNATATNGAACNGSANFPITGNQVTSISMPLTCAGITTTDPDNNGDLRVNVAVEVVDGVRCPVVTGITALPLQTSVGHDIALEGFASQTGAGITVAWAGPGGTFSSASSAATNYTCGSEGTYDLGFSVLKSGCTTNTYTVQVQCGTAVTPPVDSGVADSGPADSGPADSGPADSGPADSGPADAGPADSGPADAGPADAGPADAGPQDAGPSACQLCVQAPASPCRDFFFSGPDNVNDCFNNPNPSWVEKCVAAYRCAVTSADLCAADPTGLNKCFCGATPIETCFSGSATAQPAGHCIQEVYAVTDCTTPQCVPDRMLSETLPSYSAFYLSLCIGSVDGCGPSCPLPRPLGL